VKRTLVLVALLAAALPAAAADPPPAGAYESPGRSVAPNAVDRAVRSALRRHGIAPAPPCSDAVFLRRVFLDVLGTLPTVEEAESFLRDRREGKREALIESVLRREEFADYQSLRWCDRLRVKAEFPINLWPNAVQAYHRWVRDAVRENRPYDEIARALLTSSGSNFRVAPVNFWRAVPSREPGGLAQAVALTFLGERTEAWPEEKREGFAAFFSRVAYKKTSEWKEEVVHPRPAADEVLEAVFPDGRKARAAPGEDPRRLFADWLISSRNRRFAEVPVNRIWADLMGRGIVHEPDDFRPDNPPSNPELLEVLADALVESGYDLRAVYRLILSSATYQQSPIPRSRHERAEALFACYPVRRLDAEVLIDAICRITGSSETYRSAIPEPFTFVPAEQRTIALADGSITSPFLEMFGRPSRDTGLWSERNNRPTDGQRLHLLNSRDIQQRIQRSLEITKLVRRARGRPREVVRGIYLMILSRLPTAEEVAALEKYGRTPGLNPRQVGQDLVWALMNTKEFLYHH